WHSKKVKLVNCFADGTQPFCYADGLELEKCKLASTCDLAFEYSKVNADIEGMVTSIKNPLSGSIRADSILKIITDENDRSSGRCKIRTDK
ncbi:MAG: DUF3737 family protein, partial [Succinivibrio sp.]